MKKGFINPLSLLGERIVFFHEFFAPPYGGGNQFLLALKGELERQGHHVGVNKVGLRTRICLVNSFNFDFDEVRRVKKKYRLRMVHRVDGPVGVYRGSDFEIDKNITVLNNEIADATIFQSRYSFVKHRDLGLSFVKPSIITNAPDPAIFNSQNRVLLPDGKRKVRLIATSWSDNPRKGGEVYRYIEDYLDWDRFEFTFVGRTKEVFRKARHIPPVPSHDLAGLLRTHDIYIAASEHDPCSNALLEALACGLPVVYRDSGGHPELVGSAGLPFSDKMDIIGQIENLTRDYEAYRNNITVLPLQEVAQHYIRVMKGDGAFVSDPA